MAEDTVDATTSSGSPLERGRDALRRHAWDEAWELLARADREGPLGGRDLEALAEAAFFAAQPEQATDARERAVAAYDAAGDRPRAAYLAFDLAREYGYRGRRSIASGWLRRGERLLEGEPEGYAHGYLALVRSDIARANGDVDGALALAEEAVAIAGRTRDAELRAWGLSGLGTLRIATGATPAGLELLEEASLAAVNGELSPFAAGVICCTMISACRDLTDYGRAAEWIEATDRYCRQRSVSGFPGACRIHRAEMVAVGGGWERAEVELQQATTELGRFNAGPPLADGHYALGEVRRLKGEFELAEASLREAHALGHPPQPALALIRLAQGRVDAALTAIRAAVADEPWDRWARARLLPAQVEIELAAGERDRARQAAEELRGTVAGYPSPATEAAVHAALGRVLLAEGDAAGAARELRAGIRRWREVGNPYEIARARLVLSDALRREGDDEDADLELRAARDEFGRLGAAPDLALADRALAAADARRAAPRTERRTFMFTDIVNSTRLADVLGDAAWEPLLAWHDRTLRALIEPAGEIVNPTGDGFFAAFESAADAVEAARAIQRALAEQRRATGFALDVRIGLHTADAIRRGDDFGGVGVHAAARVGALAAAGEILATDATIRESGAGGVGERRTVEVKGIREPLVVAPLSWG